MVLRWALRLVSIKPWFTETLPQGDDADEILLRCHSLPGRRKDVLADMQKNEYYYETVFYIMLSMMNIAVLTQVKSCRGKADAVMFSPHTIFVFEIKINKPAKEALAQIDEKGYMVPFEADDRKLVKIGISFSTETRTIEIGNTGFWIKFLHPKHLIKTKKIRNYILTRRL